uniref:Uncharacterized protein n=1 Tax=Arundo donax TaxID=35708 RepID=A0A0A9GXP3_ARUDO
MINVTKSLIACTSSFILFCDLYDYRME